jgi:hypothetical protein
MIRIVKSFNGKDKRFTFDERLKMKKILTIISIWGGVNLSAQNSSLPAFTSFNG